jgi:hypothetical protein
MCGTAYIQTISASCFVHREILTTVYIRHAHIQTFTVSQDLVFREIMNVIYAWHAYIQGIWTIQSVKRWATGWSSWVRFPIAVGDFCLLHSVLTGSETHPDYYPMGTRGYFLQR